MLIRILFSAVPGVGHVNPMLPLAREARAAGHQVALLTGHEMVGRVEIPFLAVGPPIGAMVAEATKRAGTRIDLTAPQALPVAQAWRPDLVVSEYADTVGPLVATSLAIPWARMAFGPAMDDDRVAQVAESVAPRYAESGLTPTAPIAYLDPCPPSLQRPGAGQSGVHRIALRPQPHQTDGTSSAVPRFPGRRRPLIVVTLGTVFGTTAMLRTMIESLAPTGVDVICTLGAQFVDAGGLERDWVKLVDYVPLDRLLDGVSAVVSVGGAGTTLGTLERGVPLVMLPQGADHPRNVAAATRAGAAIEIHDPAETGEAVAKLLADPSITARARAVADEMRTMRSAPEALSELIGLIGPR